MLKSRSPKTDPCGTPESTTKGDERIPDTNLRLSVGLVTTKPVYITTRKSKSAKILK
jgi:hypothetical protein